MNREAQPEIDAARAGAQLDDMVGVVADRLAAADEQLRAGDRIITGVLAPPHKAAPGDRVRLEIEGLGAVELSFSA